jgi:hypothetical protein
MISGTAILIPLVKGLLGTLGGVGLVSGGGYYSYKKFLSPPPILSVLSSATGKSFSRASLVSTRKEENGVATYHYKIPSGLSVEDILKCKSAVQDKLDCDFQVWAEDKNFVFELAYNPIPKELYFDREEVISILADYECAMYLGQSRRGNVIFDFLHDNTPHLLFGGPTGGGKSNLLNQGICGMIVRYTPEELNFHLIDLKDGIELNCYADLPHTKGFYETMAEVKTGLDSIIKEIKHRNKLFKQHKGVKKLTEFNRVSSYKLPRIILIADEFAQFGNIPDKKERENMYKKWEEILQKGRSAGIHVMAGTQICDADVFPKQVKGNIDARFGFRFTDPQHSKMITGGSELTSLPNIPGRGMFKLGTMFINTQVPRIKEHQIEEIIKDFMEWMNEDVIDIVPETVDTEEDIVTPTDNEEIDLPFVEESELSLPVSSYI